MQCSACLLKKRPLWADKWCGAGICHRGFHHIYQPQSSLSSSAMEPLHAQQGGGTLKGTNFGPCCLVQKNVSTFRGKLHFRGRPAGRPGWRLGGLASRQGVRGTPQGFILCVYISMIPNDFFSFPTILDIFWFFYFFLTQTGLKNDQTGCFWEPQTKSCLWWFRRSARPHPSQPRL